ncbi:uncharacterized protein LOC130744922 [Lotus japonicus]|uniref:uncharacterized protein LOC130744922 n=1 Tax=Lotus japonicus TaxID=34305 RepID=UPI002587DCCD|nr:uncharacterized protein LOC130744922 [Lotus japonicus]
MRAHFINFFRKDGGPRPWFSNIKLNKVSDAQKHFLEADFTVEEIWDVVKTFDGNRAPRPDGFRRLVRGLNPTFIALIPKGGQQEQISDYRPISLIGSIYKLLSKVLSVRLSSVLPCLLSQNQFAFTAGLQIADCSLIANEIVHTMASRPEGGLLFKIYFAKAYDNVEWDFMLELLQEMGFGKKWISWMQVCVSTASLAVLVNGSPSDFFNIQKGLRQGDSLSPLLFNIVANGMSCMLNQLLEGDAPCGVELVPGFRINHLQFADDSLLFSNCDEFQFQTLSMAIEAYLYSSGLKVNFNKSAVYGVNAHPSLVQQAASWWNFKIGTLPFIYLGSPLGGNPRRLSFWNPVLENMTAKLGLWSSRFLSLSGRLVLIKSVMNAIPLYYMALYKAPKGIIQRIEKIMRRFLWGGPSGENKIMWVAWEDLCKGTRFGGLGVGFLEWKNKDMLLKWVWRFGREGDALWREVVCKKYGLPLQLISFNVDPADVKKLSKPLADVYGIWRDSGLVGNVFRDGIACHIGRGSGVFFRLDMWVGSVPFRVAFPRVFALAVNKRALVWECGTVVGPQWGETADTDLLIWKHDNMRLYSVKSMCAVVEARWFTEEGWYVPQFLKPILPSKIALFLWQRRWLIFFCIVPGFGCYGQLCYRGRALRGSAPELVSTLLAEWSLLRKNTSRILWELIPYALCWEIWMARNNVIFHEKLFDAKAIWESHVFLLFTWIRAWWQDCPYDVNQFARGFSKIDLHSKGSVRPVIPWKPSQGTTLKFNVDGSFQSGKAGIGGILRNNARKVIGKFSRKVEVRRADEAEVLAILYALLFYQQFMVCSVEIEIDSSLVVDWGHKLRESLAVEFFGPILQLIYVLMFAAAAVVVFAVCFADCCCCCFVWLLFLVAVSPGFCL